MMWFPIQKDESLEDHKLRVPPNLRDALIDEIRKSNVIEKKIMLCFFFQFVFPRVAFPNQSQFPPRIPNGTAVRSMRTGQHFAS